MRKRWVILGLVLVLLVGAAVAYLFATSGGMRVYGRVTLPSGEPAVGYAVYAELKPLGGSGTVTGIPFLRPIRWTTETDAEGRYELTGLRTDGELWIFAGLPGRGETAIYSPETREPGAEERIDMQLVEVRPPGR